MSRSSKGFADFFPTAPSVLQQKRSRPKEPETARKRASPIPDRRSVRPSDLTSPGHQEKRFTRDERRRSHDYSEQTPRSNDELDTNNGDLLNGVGSASSTSTNSSLFDNARSTARLNGEGNFSTSLTPLTNTELSPPNHQKSVSADKFTPDEPARSRHESRELSRHMMAQIRPHSPAVVSKARSTWSCARPGQGEFKGEKLVYDPELDKTIDRSKRKELLRKLEYRPFSKKVSHRETVYFPGPLFCEQS